MTKNEIIRRLILNDRIDVLLTCGNEEIKKLTMKELIKLYIEHKTGGEKWLV